MNNKINLNNLGKDSDIIFAVDAHDQHFIIVRNKDKEMYMDFEILGSFDSKKSLWFWSDEMMYINKNMCVKELHKIRKNMGEKLMKGIVEVDNISVILNNIHNNDYIGYVQNSRNNINDIFLIKHILKERKM